MISRRTLLKIALGAAGITAVSGVGYSHLVEPFWLAERRYDIALRSLPESFEGFTIAHLTDLHYHDEKVPPDFLRKVVARVNRIEPDLVVVTGDFVTVEARRYANPVADLLSDLRSETIGVLGNHDYGIWSSDGTGREGDDFKILADALGRAGISMLDNDRHALRRGTDRLTVVGLGELWAERFLPERAFGDVDLEQPLVVLLHNPDGIEQLPTLDNALILAGHTHGGQIYLPLVGRPRLPIRNRKYAYGMLRYGDSDVYVNAGIGYSRQIRFFARPEIVVFTLRGG